MSVDALRFLNERGVRPVALLLSNVGKASHADALRALCPELSDDKVIRGQEFRSERGMALLRELAPDWIVGVHFPYIVPAACLKIPKFGFLNLHPAFLPYNRGWHTPSWAILDGTPYGATIHFMSEGVDEGDIVAQKRIETRPWDTADSLYARVMQAEVELFREAWPAIVEGTFTRLPQDIRAGSKHVKEDMLLDRRRELRLDEPLTGEELFRRLRAYTTNKAEEGLYMIVDGRKVFFRLQVNPESGTV